MKIEYHKKGLRESTDVIKECIQVGLSERQKTVGFHCSSASIELFEMFLHKLNFLEPSAQLKHNWFGSEHKIDEKLSFDFPDKDRIVRIMIEIEKNRNLLCYAKPQPEKVMEQDIRLLEELKKIMREEGVEYE